MIPLLLAQLEDSSWANKTTAHPAGLAMLAVFAVWVYFSPRRLAMVPFFLMACLAARQRIVIATLDFDFLRILVMVGWARIMTRGELSGFRWKPIDVTLILWGLVSLSAYSVLHNETGAAIRMAGNTFDAVGGYILFRCLIRGWPDVLTLIRAMAVIAIPIAVFFFIERMTRRNIFSILGGVPLITVERNGSLRCQGAFVHPILAGSFWAALLPLFFALWFGTLKDRALSVLSVGSALLIIVACASSTPLAGVAAAMMATGLYLFRYQMPIIRWAAFLTALGMHLSMNKPIWHLIGRYQFVSGSTGYHRYRLIDAFVRNFNEWWLNGVVSTAHWGRWLQDVTNEYVLQGVKGGLATLVLFLLITYFAFRGVGKLWRLYPDNSAPQRFAWALGAVIFTHMVIFIAVSYFGQISTLWIMNLAMVGSMTPVAARAPKRAPQPTAQADRARAEAVPV